MIHIKDIRTFKKLKVNSDVRIYKFGWSCTMIHTFYGMLSGFETSLLVFVSNNEYSVDFLNIQRHEFNDYLFFTGEYDAEVFKKAWQEMIKKQYEKHFDLIGLPF